MNKVEPVAPSDVCIRDFLPEDILPCVDYWTGNSEEFWRDRGVDKSKLKSRDEFIAAYEHAFKQMGDVWFLCTIVYKDIPIGVHALTDLLEGKSGVFHAHIWDKNCRGKGIGMYSYLKAADFFMKKLKLKKIVFKTPKINVAANRIKQKIGIPCLGETTFESPILIKPLEANLYELDRPLLDQLLRRFFMA